MRRWIFSSKAHFFQNVQCRPPWYVMQNISSLCGLFTTIKPSNEQKLHAWSKIFCEQLIDCIYLVCISWKRWGLWIYKTFPWYGTFGSIFTISWWLSAPPSSLLLPWHSWTIELTKECALPSKIQNHNEGCKKPWWCYSQTKFNKCFSCESNIPSGYHWHYKKMINIFGGWANFQKCILQNTLFTRILGSKQFVCCVDPSTFSTRISGSQQQEKIEEALTPYALTVRAIIIDYVFLCYTYRCSTCVVSSYTTSLAGARMKYKQTLSCCSVWRTLKWMQVMSDALFQSGP